MNDKRIKEDCPFCGTDKSQIQISTIFKNKDKGKFVEIYYPNCNCNFQGYGIMNIIAKWNTRYR